MMVVAEKTSHVGLHMIVSFGVMYVCTGSIAYGGVAAVLEPICMVALGPLHDRIWHAIKRRRQCDGANAAECDGAMA